MPKVICSFSFTATLGSDCLSVLMVGGYGSAFDCMLLMLMVRAWFIGCFDFD